MEDSPYTEATLRIVHDTYRQHENTGAVLQAYMRRSIEDVQLVIDAGFSVRLCKGIYDEPRSIAYKDFDTVRQNYIFLLDELLKGGVYVGIATHDEFLIWHALRLIHQLEVPEDRYEFQMLLGVDEELRSILVEAGHKLRVYVPFGRGLVRVLDQASQGEPQDRRLRREGRDRRHNRQGEEIGA